MTVLTGFFRRADRQSRLMGEMMDRIGLQLDDAGRVNLGIPLRMAARVCLLCRRSDACEAWLASHRGPAEAPGFCPNAGFFRRVRAPDPARR